MEDVVFLFVRTKIGTAIAYATRKKGSHFFLRKKTDGWEAAEEAPDILGLTCLLENKGQICPILCP